ncbi:MULTISPECIES: sugar transferase [unclassified Luteococcus]|uniref:sugar transferase n=1 Tax=unclassified Luteococcus TaxID=2639923 RepID=UPI00313E5BD2
MDAKRAFDLCGATALLAVTAPVMVVSAAAVAAESRGGVFFRQERVGLHGETFRIRKFRTMRPSAGGALVTVAGDNRVTRVGRLLRASKLDELPQLIDVVEGRMSLVGPRPEVAKYVAQWPEELRDQILSVRPGITDPMSVEFRNESELLAQQDDPERYYVEVLLPRKAQGYAEYVANRSLVGDLRILLGTVRAVVTKRA